MNMPSLFISHTHTDKPFARKIANDLKMAGVKVWIDEAEINVGDSLIEKIRLGIDEMDYLGVVLSPEAVQSEWVKREVDIAMNQEIGGKRVKVLPLLYKPCELPGFIVGKLYADFTDAAEYNTSLALILRRLGINTSEIQTIRKIDDHEILVDFLTTKQATALAKISIDLNTNIFFSADEEINRKKGADALYKLARKHEAVVDLIIEDAQQYASWLHIDDASPYNPNSFDVLEDLALQYPKIIDFMERVLKTDYGLPRWQAIESLCSIESPKAEQILERLVNGGYGPYPIGGYGINWDISEVERYKGAEFVKSALSRRT